MGIKDIQHKYVKGVDELGHTPFNTIFGDNITAKRNAKILEQFQYNINTKTLTSTTNGTGTVTQENAMAKLSTGTDTDGAARLESKNTLRYQPGCETVVYFTALWESPGVAGCKQRAGIWDRTDGYYLGFNGTDFVVGYEVNGTETEVTIDDFNGDAYKDAIDFTKINIFRISWGWLGVAPIDFAVLDSEGNVRKLHTFKLPNTLTVPHSFNPVLPICFDVVKTTGATDIIMRTASWNASVVGGETGIGDRFFSGTIGPQSVTTEVVLINFQNVSTFQSKTNRTVVEAVLLGMSSEGNKSAIIKIYKNLTIGGTPSWSNVDATNSVMQTDTAGTVTPSNANLLFSFPLAKSDSTEMNVKDFDFILRPGETATVTGQSSVANDLTFTARWRELF